jgi:hypothetical protein
MYPVTPKRSLKQQRSHDTLSLPQRVRAFRAFRRKACASLPQVANTTSITNATTNYHRKSVPIPRPPWQILLKNRRTPRLSVGLRSHRYSAGRRRWNASCADTVFEYHSEQHHKHGTWQCRRCAATTTGDHCRPLFRNDGCLPDLVAWRGHHSTGTVPFVDL